MSQCLTYCMCLLYLVLITLYAGYLQHNLVCNKNLLLTLLIVKMHNKINLKIVTKMWFRSNEFI